MSRDHKVELIDLCGENLIAIKPSSCLLLPTPMSLVTHSYIASR